MRLNKANIAGLPSPLQQAEMKSVLVGTWPPLKPLPVFKYETDAFRATIDFDKLRGEWVCRKTSFPSNIVQELRGGLREITMALPHSEAQGLPEGTEPVEQELEKDAHRRLQAIQEWIQNFENGALFFELRDYLSESQRTELSDSLRLSLTARQLQFSSKNLASVYDALSTSGGRFATLIDFAKRSMAKQGSNTKTRGEGAVPEAEGAIDHDKPPAKSSFHEFGHILTDSSAPDDEAPAHCSDADNLPALSIKNVLPEHTSLSEGLAHTASHEFEIQPPETTNADSPWLLEDLQEEGPHPPPFPALATQLQTGKGKSSTDRIERSSLCIPALEISGVQLVAFALVFLLAVVGFAGGFTALRSQLEKHFRKRQNSALAVDDTSQALPHVQDQTTAPSSTPPAANPSNAPAANVAAWEAEELRPGSPSVQSSDSQQSDSASGVWPTKPSSTVTSSSVIDSGHCSGTNNLTHPEGISEQNGWTKLITQDESRPASRKSAHSPETNGLISGTARNSVPQNAIPLTVAPLHASRPSAILVTAPAHGSKPLRVTFPRKAIAASSSFAMTSQLSVLVSPEPKLTAGHKPARLQAGELVSFVWPRYSRVRDHYGSAETVKVRTTIGQFGQVLDVKFLSGSTSLLPATMRAIHQWRYTPTLLDKRPVQAQQDVTIEFRPP
jgi:Gram-negative bacterial TonB protein C-terminal